MKEKIIRIEEATFKSDAGSWSNKDGYQIITNKQTIKIGIDPDQCCCENAGYFMSEDDLSSFVGAELISIELTDTALQGIDFEKGGCAHPTNEWFEGNIMFVNFNTSMGLLQFVAYNEHNGYYGHEACIISSQLNHAEIL